jgi:hypothetical protein
MPGTIPNPRHWVQFLWPAIFSYPLQNFLARICRLKFLFFRVLLKRLFPSVVEFMIHLLNIERLNVERLWQTAQRGRIECWKSSTANTTQRRKTKHRNYLMSKAKNATQHRKTERRIKLQIGQCRTFFSYTYIL